VIHILTIAHLFVPTQSRNLRNGIQASESQPVLSPSTSRYNNEAKVASIREEYQNRTVNYDR
jgi:hypothetical protein